MERYFVLDMDDIMYDDNHDTLYRLVAKKRFDTVDPYSNGLFRKKVTIYPGEKGGYVGSRYCLEEAMGVELKPWVFFCASVSVGSVLSGTSVISGNTKLINNAVVEGGNALKDTTVNGSRICSKEYCYNNHGILISLYADGKTEIVNSYIRGKCIRLHAAILDECGVVEKNCGIEVINSDLHNLIVKGNVRIKDTTLKSGVGQKETIVSESSWYESGCLKNESPQKIMIPVDEGIYSYDEAYEKIKGKEEAVRGIYKHVDYKPIETWR